MNLYNTNTPSVHTTGTGNYLKIFKRTFLFLALAPIILAACSSDSNPTEADIQIAHIQISPDSLSISTGETANFSAFVITTSGDTLQDSGIKFHWWSTDTNIFTVENNGSTTGQSAGTAFCVIEVLAKSKINFTGRDSAFVRVF